MNPIRNERGGMTLFAVLTVSALLLLAVVLSDVVRARMAASEAEAEARRTARSLLSAFEPALLKYGLFGASDDTARKEAIRQGGEEAERKASSGTSFGWYDAIEPAQAAITADPLYDLGDHRVLQRQILERMKYIAPIEYGIDIVQKFNVGKQHIAMAQQYAQMSKEMAAAVKKRDDALDRAWTIAQRIGRSAGSSAGGASLQPEVSKLQDELSQAEQANDEIRKLLNAPPPVAPGGPETQFPHVTVYPPTYFVQYVTGAARIASRHGAWHAAKEKAEKEQQSSEDQTEGDKDELEDLRAEVREAASEWLAERKTKEDERERERGHIRRMEADTRRAAEEQLNRRRDNWKDFCTVDTYADYLTLTGPEGLFEKYRAYNGHLSSGGIDPGMNAGGAEAYMDASLGFLDKIVKSLEGLRDETYVNEYALTHFTYRTSDKQKYVAKVKTNIGNADAHRLKGQEAEYILYGLPACYMNLSAMHVELFALRTGLRTLEALLQPESPVKAASPLAALLAALVEGAKKANDDVDVLLAGEDIELPFVPGVTMNYKDHLRLFYLLHSRDESTLSRMQALIELNTGIDLTKRFTAIRVRSESKTDGMLVSFPPIRKEVVESY